LVRFEQKKKKGTGERHPCLAGSLDGVKGHGKTTQQACKKGMGHLRKKDGWGGDFASEKEKIKGSGVLRKNQGSD